MNTIKNRNRSQLGIHVAQQLVFALTLSTCYHPIPRSDSTTTTESSSSDDSNATSFNSNTEPSSGSETDSGPFDSLCGNGIIESGEVCDHGENNGSYDFCNADCSAFGPWCGDEEVQESEECDDGNMENFDGCDNSCKSSCGNGVVEALAGEECDHGTNNADHRECTSTCKLNVCGDGLLFDGMEECDHGANNANANECTSICTLNVCGDSFALAGTEECDDGNKLSKDGCENNCTRTLDGIILGAYHACVLDTSKKIRCWGSDAYEQIGDEISKENIGDQPGEMPPPDIDVGGSILQLSAGHYHTCALLNTNEVRCWGTNPHGQLGYNNTESVGESPGDMPPGKVDVGEGTIDQIAVGHSHTCVLFAAGNVRCWGGGGFGELGYENTFNIGDGKMVMMPPQDVDFGGKATQIATGTNHTCVLLDTGNVRCWGMGSSGQLGYDDSNNIGDGNIPMPPQDVNVGGTVKQLVAGDNHTCVLLDTGKVRCWGGGSFGQLGYGNSNNIGDGNIPMPPQDVDIGGTAVQLVAGYNHACVILTTGNVRCWGQNNLGQLGYGHPEIIGNDLKDMPPDDVELGDTAVQLTAKAHNTCVLLRSGQVRCWGLNGSGQLGYGHTENIGDDELPSSVGVVPIF